ncbi:dihydroxyacetone kinase [Listeria grayi]|uniref:DhaL domain-containing protein n=1 Tax=Listeria grayi FSL F6-1183 TaxID=1265827 RepID=A0A829R6J5_LISGR|nr:DAK2 domain-containing protein [Listeria grayi]EUJ27007.1 hypothetical protein LMUR_10892 [Listeria grayi FSL F6-1183]VEI33194.1 dihydroxyacetone kinase [Listeria grayi]
MGTKQIDAEKLAAMIALGAENLAKQAEFVDSLNVFPVPDGDTGTNMNLSMSSGAAEVAKTSHSTVSSVGASLAKGLLMGARGNSGVILSQLFRGFAKAIETKTELDAETFAAAFARGVETAYKAVMKPVEGTILTVAREAAKAGMEAAKAENDVEKVMRAVVEKGQIALEHTPEQLPVLKEVGVVDSGGQGLMFIYEGFLSILTGEVIPESKAIDSMKELVNAEHHRHVQDFMDTSEIEFGYCTEMIVQIKDQPATKKAFDEGAFRQDLSEMGDSLLVAADEEIVKVHVHAEHPGEVLNYGEQYGTLLKIKIENMREQHQAIVGEEAASATPTVKYGIISISAGSGIEELFKSMGTTYVLSGGQTMNPSTADITKAIEQVNAEYVFVLPNNKNIQMAAEQAAEVAGNDKVKVIPTRSIPQGLAALLAFQEDESLETNEVAMKEASQEVKSGQVTTAVRDTTIDGVAIKKNDFIGLVESKIVVSTPSLEKTAIDTLAAMLDEDVEIVTVLVGENVEQTNIDAIAAYLEETDEDIELEIHQGGQPVYPFLFSVE